MVRDKTGLLIDAYFSGTKVKWILDNVKVQERKRSKAICYLERLIHGLFGNYLVEKRM